MKVGGRGRERVLVLAEAVVVDEAKTSRGCDDKEKLLPGKELCMDSYRRKEVRTLKS